MKILVYGINYYPELIGIGKYSSEMCDWLAEQGHDVEVITAMPFYPHWKINSSYKGRWWHTEMIGKVKVHRCPLYIPSQVTGKSRVLHEISFAVSSSVYWGVCLFKKYDLVLCIAPPLQVALPGVVYNIFHKSIFMYHIQDLQLDAAKHLGLIKSKILLSIVSRLEKFLLKKSHFISTISEGMLLKLHLKNVPKEKLFILRNWTDTKLIYPDSANADVKKLFKLDHSKKIVLYSGNIGEKQGIDILLEVAESLVDHNIMFLVIGDGSYKPKFEETIMLKGLKNIKVFPLQPLELLNKILNMADVHLVLQKKAAADLVMPSKFSTILSVGGIAIVTADKNTTLYDLIKFNDVAIVIEPENPIVLRDAILLALTNDLIKYKLNARAYALKYLDKEVIMNSFQDFIFEKGLVK